MREWFNIRNDLGQESIRIDIYGSIGKSWWDDEATSAKDVLDAIKDANGRPIEIHVNSEGGNVWDGFAIHTILRESPSEVTAYIDGLAASAASYIVEAADHVIMSDIAWIMIHEASSMVWGNKSDMAKEASVLEKIDNTIASVYASQSSSRLSNPQINNTAEEFLRLMEEETWIDADTAIELGLVDEVSKALPAVAHIDLSSDKALEKAPEKARDAIKAMAMHRISDTSSKIQSVNDEGAKPEKKLQAFRVIDGRIFHIE